MQLTFTNSKVFKWDASMWPSTNNGSNNPGWVIVAPYDWKIAYINSGNNNESGSFLVTNESGNLNFNISGYHKGSGGDDDNGTLIIKNADLEEYYKEYHKPVYNRLGKDDTIILRDGTALVGANKNRQHFGYVQIDQSGTLALAVGNNKTYINVDINYAIENGNVKLWFDGDKYANIKTGGIIAVVAAAPMNERVMDPGHAAIGIGKDKAATALKAYSPNGDMKHKNAITWLDRVAQAGDYLFVHIAGLQVDDLTDIIGCTFDRKEGPFTRKATIDYTISVVITNVATGVVTGNGLGEWQLPAGEYTVELFVNGESYTKTENPITVTVTAGGTTNLDFGDVIVGEGKNEITCGFCNK
jgi:hypothetical protein